MCYGIIYSSGCPRLTFRDEANERTFRPLRAILRHFDCFDGGNSRRKVLHSGYVGKESSVLISLNYKKAPFREMCLAS